MRIPCPFCGDRDVHEFSYLGDAAPVRPSTADLSDRGTDMRAAFHDYVYLRDNPAGIMKELWYHASGCRSWIEVLRDTRTHAIDSARLVRDTPR